MKKINLFKIAVFAISFSLSNAYALDNVQKSIRVSIILDASSFTAGSSKDFFVYDSANKKFKLTKGTVNVYRSQIGARIGKYDLSLPVRIEPSKGAVFANFKPYRGYLVLKKSGDKMNIINVLDIEDYIKGVLPKEIGDDWHMEALKTQAVISRTYAISNLNSHSSQGFDLCSTTHCQVYGGLGAETKNTNQAVLETKGQVLTYQGKPAQTVFHAACGGSTEDPKYVWGWKETPPYLKGVKCRYCCNSPHAKWEQSLDENFIRAKLKDNTVGKIKSIKIKGKTSSGAAKELEITHSNGKCILNAYKFRLNIDAWKIKSHFFDSIKIKDDKICFKGKGWGHKAGLCQCGAKGMAEKGKTYSKILVYFYPKTKIETVKYK
ncbi:MAG: SpoIID/LytB domain-containing protein [Endomicrobium sp.]|jgi:stage II sporulation protein D|nr:SpoIID/LytB domain-containing protein [Endomicrobium sp.]